MAPENHKFMFNILKDKKNLIIAGIAVIILVTALILALANRNQTEKTKTPEVILPTPEFLTAKEKADFRLADNVKAQVLSRNASGTPAVYRLIKSDSDIVDPSKIGPISPRQTEGNK